jgi:putative transposase
MHIFLSHTPTCSLSGAIRILKCNSARMLFNEFPGLRRRFWSGHLWPEGKFYRSIGNLTAGRRYSTTSPGRNTSGKRIPCSAWAGHFI